MARTRGANSGISATVRTGNAVLNIRQEPSIYSTVVTQVPNGTSVTVEQGKGAPDGWTKLSNGYAMTKYLVLEAE